MLHRSRLASITLLGTLVAGTAAACDSGITVDDPTQNPGILAPTGVIRGTVTYIGPGPCIRRGLIEGTAVLLVFDAANPPPPDGFATTALNFVTIPGEALFASYPRPASGPGSVNDQSSLCVPLDSAPVTATASYSIPYMAAGHYQVRGFYSRQGRFNPLFDYANLPLAGDVGGGALVDPRTGKADFATINVGVEASSLDGGTDAGSGSDLVIPPSGFVRDNVAVILGSTIPLNRPYFNIDPNLTTSYDLAAFAADSKITGAKDLSADATELVTPAIRKTAAAMKGAITMRQDHATTSQTDIACLGSSTCSVFHIAQASFPQIRLRYGFPGDATKITSDPYGADAWIAAASTPALAFAGELKRPYYDIDPFEFYKGVGGTPIIGTSGSFVLSRAVNPVDGTPDILHDNADLENTAQIANLYPLVLLAKLADDGAGNVLMPPRAQTDPVVLLQTFTLNNDPNDKANHDGSMIATSTSTTLGGTLADPSNPLNSTAATSALAADAFSVLVRPAALCLYPDQPKGNFKGTVVSPLEFDPNPANMGNPLMPLPAGQLPQLVDPARVVKYNAAKVSQVEFGCLPPGTYQINVVYPATGQAWGVPNLMGHASYDATYKQVEQAIIFATTGANAISTTTAFSQRPLLQSQALYATDANGQTVTDANGNPIAQVLVVEPSPRCMNTAGQTESTACTSNDQCNGLLCVTDAVDGNKYCDLNGNGVIDYTYDPATNAPKAKSKVWVNNTVNEDVAHTGLLDGTKNKDLNGNGKLDLKIPNVCVDSYATYSRLTAAAQAN
jgi:hypothetical protein